MKLYYYATESALSALWDQEIKVASPCDFNDPFEFLPSTENVTPENRTFCHAFQGSSRHHYYVLSMSERPNNIRMWAQYAANHTGLMIELNWDVGIFKELSAGGALRKVDYENPKRVVIDPSNLSDKDILEVLTRKGNDWAQEQEWRLIFTSDFLERIGGRHKLLNGQVAAFIPLRDECVSRVTVGHRSSSILFDSIEAIKRNRQAKWPIAKAKLSDYEFLLIDEQSA
ncbi:DUF2971 domain-containing protein [Horticoccus sp. 23ND18S-11]|uniref:DUF2971 domain-containing protein n=1 Tax=Horticoccus sp. 23ND18S-11 TaxID=3391832 RepID=UPI0039C9A01C